MLKPADQMITATQGLQQFLQQCDIYQYCESVVAILDMDCKVLYSNLAYQKLQQCFHITDYYPGLCGRAFDMHQLAQQLQQCIVTGRHIQHETLCYLNPGTHFTINLLMRPIYDAAAKAISAVMLTVSEESVYHNQYAYIRLQQERLELLQRIRSLSDAQQSQNRLVNALLKETPFAIMLVDSDAKVIQMNRVCEQLLQTHTRECTGIDVSQFIQVVDDDNRYARISASGEAIHQQDCIALCMDGTQRDILLSTVMLHVDESPIFLEAFVDITQRKIAEQALVDYKGELEQLIEKRTSELNDAVKVAESANNAKSQFLSQMSHELRTPLNAIMGFSQILKYDIETGKDISIEYLEDTVDEILQGGEHLLLLVNELLDLSRIEKNELQIQPQRIDAKEIIASTVKFLRPYAEKNHISINKNCDNNSSMIYSDPLRLKEILLNLMSNAVKYTQPGGSMTIECFREDDRQRISVSDSGPGLSPEEQQHIFEPFSRLGAEYTGIEGTGIGLTIVKKLVDLLHGDITLISTPGIGTTFSIYLPVYDNSAASQTH